MPATRQYRETRTGNLLVDQLHTPHRCEDITLRDKHQRRGLDTRQLVGGVVMRTGTVRVQIGIEGLRVGGKQLSELCDAVRMRAVETRRDGLPEQ